MFAPRCHRQIATTRTVPKVGRPGLLQGNERPLPVCPRVHRTHTHARIPREQVIPVFPFGGFYPRSEIRRSRFPLPLVVTRRRCDSQVGRDQVRRRIVHPPLRLPRSVSRELNRV